MPNMKLYNYIIKNAATKKHVKVTIVFFLILAAKECSMTKRIKLLCLPLTKCNLIYFMLLAPFICAQIYAMIV